MLYGILLMICLELPMGKIIYDSPAVITTVVTKKIYVVTDKFGVDHEGETKEAAKKAASEEDKKPFQMTDRCGQIWEHVDKATLEKWIKIRNGQL